MKTIRIVKKYRYFRFREGHSCRCSSDEMYTNVYDCASDYTIDGWPGFCPFSCNKGMFYCGDGTGKCIPDSYQCDSDNDCENGKDEEGCRITRKYSEHEIRSGTKLVGGKLS